jgi:hypothetical protein
VNELQNFLPKKGTLMLSQRNIYEKERRRLAAADRTFMDIMSGPNPLSSEEIRHLIDTKGGIWKRYEAFASTMDKQDVLREGVSRG